MNRSAQHSEVLNIFLDSCHPDISVCSCVEQTQRLARCTVVSGIDELPEW